MEQVGTASGGHPDLNLTPEEKRVYGQLFQEADPDGFGAVSGDVAVKFFERTKLRPDILGQIWQIADTENRGFLTPSGFGVVLRLIGHAQAGRAPSLQVARTPAPLPKFDALPGLPAPPQAPQSPAPLAAQTTGTPTSPSSATGPVRVPALSPEKVSEYSSLFDSAGAENGMLSGQAARRIFERSRLPNEVLGRIWNLADTQGQGSLNVTGFVIAMHLLASYKSGAMRGVPSVLPTGLLDAAARRPPTRLSGGPQRAGSGAGLPGQPLPPQFTGGQPQSPIVRAQVAFPQSAQSTGEPWTISTADKARFDQVFSTIDTAGQGFISGEQAVTFFGNARLPEETLAQIWDLSDINSDGVLNRDEFAVAMYLIRQHRASRDGQLPQSLPLALIPPSMRKQVAPPAPQTQPEFAAAPVTKPPSAADDLFGLSVNEQETRQLQQQSQQSLQPNQNTNDPLSSSAGVMSAAIPQSNVFKPFVPSSNFGQGLVPQSTGQSQQPRSTMVDSNLLDDSEPAAATKGLDDAAERGNMSNQISNLSNQMNGAQQEKLQTQQQLTQNNQQKQVLQQRLVQIRAAYEQELTQVKSLKEQLTASQADTKRLQQDMAMIEGTHADLKTQTQQLSTALQSDQQENTSLKERIRLMNAEIEQMKPNLEKIRADARQQKGLVAINRKQLATNEAERERIQSEIVSSQQEHQNAIQEFEETVRLHEQTQRELENHRTQLAEHTRSITASRQDLEQRKIQAAESARQAEISRQQLAEEAKKAEELRQSIAAQRAEEETQARQRAAQSATRDVPIPVASPTPSMSSNPFFRKQGDGMISPPPMDSQVTSPARERDLDDFDSIFGPSAAATTQAPPVAFGRKEEGLSDTPRAIEPPAPPSAVQITSAALPLGGTLSRQDSTTSSVRVAAPATRASAATPRALTPDTSTASPASRREDDPFKSSPVDEHQESIRQTLPRGNTLQKVETLPGAFPTEEGSTNTAQSSANPAAVTVGTGLATLAAGAGLGAAATSQQDNKQDALQAPNQEATRSEFDDFFGGPAHKKTNSEQVADFDSAFASMGAQRNNAPARPTTSEFPDIKELDDGDDDSSEDSEPARGFDDNFGSAPGAPSASALSSGKQPEAASAVPASLSAPPLQTTSSSRTLPGFDEATATSPPSYGQVVPQDNSNHFPQEYKNLLPERGDPTSPPAGGESIQKGNNSASYGPEHGQAPVSHKDVIAPAPNSNAPFDFDSAFANMGSAPVADDSDSDSDGFTSPRKGRQLSQEFNDTFTSPAANIRTNPTIPQSGSSLQEEPRSYTSGLGSSIYSSVTAPQNLIAPTTNGFSSTTTQSAHPVKAFSFDEFNSDTIPAPRTGTDPPLMSSSVTSPPAANNVSSHDWDALFAPLTSTDIRPESTRIGDAQAAVTTAEPVRDLTPPPSTAAPITPSTQIMSMSPSQPRMEQYNPPERSPPTSFQTQNTPVNNTYTIGNNNAGSTNSGSNTRLSKPDRPQPGRALSTGTEHDDPILKRLTAMGWGREQSLAALEKFDYNIDKAADYLTFQS